MNLWGKALQKPLLVSEAWRGAQTPSDLSETSAPRNTSRENQQRVQTEWMSPTPHVPNMPSASREPPRETRGNSGRANRPSRAFDGSGSGSAVAQHSCGVGKYRFSAGGNRQASHGKVVEQSEEFHRSGLFVTAPRLHPHHQEHIFRRCFVPRRGSK